MKKLYKIMLAALFSISCFVPLSVYAEEDFNDSMGVMPLWVTGDEPYLTTEQLSWLNSNATFTNSIIYQFVSGVNNGAVVYSNNITSWTDFNSFSFQGYTWLSSDGTATYDSSSVSLDFSGTSDKIVVSLNYNGTTYFNICQWYSSSLNYCSVSPTPTPTPTPDSSGCPLDSLNVLSNPEILSLVRTALLTGSSNWSIGALTQTSGSYGTGTSATDCSHINPYGFRHGYFLNYIDSSGTARTKYHWLYQKPGSNVQSVSGSGCRVSSPATWTTVSTDTILTKSCYDELVLQGGLALDVNDSKGNDLLENGNSSTQESVVGIDSVTNSLDSSANQYEQFESQFNSNLTSSLDNIDVNSINLVNSNDFVKTASWVKVQFDDVLDSSGIYKTAISFVLIIGLALLLLGRRL